MHVIFMNPQGNFDPADSHLTEHPDFGGQLVYVKEVARAMAKAGHKVDIVTRLIDDPDWPEFASPVDHYPGDETNLRILRLPCGGPAFLNKERLWDHLEEFVTNVLSLYGEDLPQFVTAHYADGGYCAALMQQRCGIAFTFTAHSLGAQKLDKLGTDVDNFGEMETRFAFSRRIAAERLSMARAARIVTSTDQERREQYSHPLYAGAVDIDGSDRFSVIPPGVNTEIFTPEKQPADAAIYERLGAQLDGAAGPFVIVSSRLDEKKNIIGVVEAFRHSEELRRHVRLIICIRGVDDPDAEIGRLPEAEQIVLRPILRAIDDGHLGDHVRFLNIQSQGELAATYRYLAERGSVFALTAFYEPFGLAPIEAAACGIACVATKNGGPSEVFADGSGVLVDPFAPDDIARGLLEGLENHAELSARAYRRIHADFTWENTAAGYLEVIRQADAAASAAPPEAILPLDAAERIRAYLEKA